MEKKKVLIVDDDDAFLKAMKVRLETSGYEVIAASNGKEGLEKVEAKHPDAVLLDIMMPDINGLEVLRQIRSRDPHLPVFMLTAYSSAEMKKTERELNATGLIMKTGDMADEIQNISTAIEMAVKYRGRQSF